MWDILDYAGLSRHPQKPGRGLFDPSFVQHRDEEEEDEETVETQIFHRPTAEVDMSNGGQELPPYSDLAVRRNPRLGRGRNGYSAPPEDRQSLQRQQQQSEIATWPEPPLLGNMSIMDVTHDPFFLPPDHGNSSYYMGCWDIGNL